MRYIILILILFITGCDKKHQKSFFAMNTVITITIIEHGNEKIVPEKAFKISFNEIKRIENKYNMNGSGWLAKLNINKKAKIDSETKNILNNIFMFNNKYKNIVDPALGNLKKLWNIGTKDFKLPTNKEIKLVLKECGINNVKITEDEIFLKNNINLDMGAFIKGYSTDSAVKLLVKNGYNNILVDAGGDIRAHGDKEWTVGLRDPFTKDIKEIIKLKNGAIATSGNYERFSIFKGKKYHHIFNPLTGYPSNNGLSSATAICNNAFNADICATALMIMNFNNIKQFKFNCSKIIVINNKKKVYHINVKK